MTKNMGTADKTIRILAAILIVILYFTGQISGTLALILGIAAVLMLLTSLVSFCPLYGLLKCSTRKDKVLPKK